MHVVSDCLVHRSAFYRSLYLVFILNDDVQIFRMTDHVRTAQKIGNGTHCRIAFILLCSGPCGIVVSDPFGELRFCQLVYGIDKNKDLSRLIKHIEQFFRFLLELGILVESLPELILDLVGCVHSDGILDIPEVIDRLGAAAFNKVCNSIPAILIHKECRI